MFLHIQEVIDIKIEKCDVLIIGSGGAGLRAAIDAHNLGVEVKTSIEKAKQIIDKAIKVLNNDTPESSKECEYCKFRNNAV